ncbi:MAG TPA: DUF1015 domain-containing protein [Candidatus Dormibacteraeota bacterium]|nr:DUF1015 domain-containing protein [Candidatus Dormibacteraeota bacterium]
MPTIRPFRALRYSREMVDDLSTVVAPPYDVISPAEHAQLLARDSRNVVRLDLPEDEPGDPPDERYRRAARTLTAWRSDGTLRRDPRPALYPYEQTYRIPGTERVATRRGLFARVVLEPFGTGSGIRPHERTLAEPREDRYRLLRATGVNTSPVVGLGADRSGAVATWLGEIAATAPVADLVDDAGVRHRLWAATVGEDGARDAAVQAACDLLGATPITLADGHHRYETALRYAEERRTGPAIEGDPAWAEILMLILEPVEGTLTVLPTHRVLLGLDEAAVAALVAGAPELFEVTAGLDREVLLATFDGSTEARGGEGRFGLWTRHGGAILHARRAAFVPWLPAGGAAVRRLDVTLASVAIERLAGIGPAAVAEGRIAYTMSAAEAMAWVDAGAAPTGSLPASAALLLDPTPASEIVAVAADGDVMPQKSTYIYPKAITGLVINPLE